MRTGLRSPGWRLFVHAACVLLSPFAFCSAAHSAPLERRLELSLDIEGQQDWHNGLQWSKATTRQHYELATTLRSDGVLRGANLLDLDMDRRLAIKQEYLRRQGLEEAKRANGGSIPLPKTDEDKKRLSDQVQLEMFNCKGDPDCMYAVVRRYSAVLATAGTPGAPADNGAGATLLDGPGRFLFFFGYDGCPNQMHSTQATHTEGARAYDRARKNLVPFTSERNGDSTGNAADRKSLCWRYTAVIDTQDNKLFLDNVYLPSAHGSTIFTERGSPQTQEEDLPPLSEAMSWASQSLRQADASGATTATVNLSQPLDGNATVLGTFEGTAKLRLKWSFLPAAPENGTPAHQ
jgi:hypothetical protein